MKFLFLNSARNWGGNEKWIYLATQALSKEHKVFLAYRSDDIGKRFFIQKQKLSFRCEFDVVTYLRLYQFIKTNKVQILIPTKPKEYFIAGILAKIIGNKNIIRLGIVRDLRRNWIKDVVYNKLADGIIVNAQQIKAVLMKSSLMSFDKIRVIYNGLNVSELEELSKSNSNFKKPCNFMIIAMGELSDRKGFDDLLHGFAYFLHLSKAEDACLVIVGDGAKLEYLKNLTEQLKLSKRVIFTGFLENPYPLLRAADVFVSSSKNEGISNALLEAMYFKNAVITTSVGGADYVIDNGKNGFLIEEDDKHENIGKYICELYQNIDRRIEFGENGRQTVIDKFSLSTMKREIVNFCQELSHN